MDRSIQTQEEFERSVTDAIYNTRLAMKLARERAIEERDEVGWWEECNKELVAALSALMGVSNRYGAGRHEVVL